jgi:hypothetical protein
LPVLNPCPSSATKTVCKFVAFGRSLMYKGKVVFYLIGRYFLNQSWATPVLLFVFILRAWRRFCSVFLILWNLQYIDLDLSTCWAPNGWLTFWIQFPKYFWYGAQQRDMPTIFTHIFSSLLVDWHNQAPVHSKTVYIQLV